MPGNSKGARGPNGRGTVYFDDKRGRWRGRWTRPNGTRGEVYAPTQAECLAKMDAAMRTEQRGYLPAGETLATWLAYWLEHECNHLRPGTLADYRSMVYNHLAPELKPGKGARSAPAAARVGGIRLDKLQHADVQRLANGLAAAGLAPASIAKAMAVLRAALSRAKALGKVQDNAAALVRVRGVSAKPVAAPTRAEIDALLAAFEGHELEALVTAAITTGLRQGELLGLTWADVDLDHANGARLFVRHQLQRVGGAGLATTEPKTSTGRRMVPLGALAVSAFQRQRARQGRLRLAAGDKWRDTGLVFTGAHGQGLDGGAVLKRFKAGQAAAGLPVFTWHQLRHGYASLQASEGASLEAVGTDLGHADVRTTRRYAELFDDARRESAARMDRALPARKGGEAG